MCLITSQLCIIRCLRLMMICLMIEGAYCETRAITFCPDVCFCRYDPPEVLRISCRYFNFKTIPTLNSKVKILEFQKNTNISLVQGGAFQGLRHLGDLTLTSMDTWTIHDNAFEGLAKMINMTMKAPSSTRITSKLFSPLVSLETLRLSTGLSAIPSEAICKLTNLRTLDVSDNNLSDDIYFGKCLLGSAQRLSRITLSSNNITVLRNRTFENLRNTPITELYLVGTNDKKLLALEENVFRPLDKLREIILRGNAITSLPDYIFINNRALKSINLKNNDLSAVLCKQITNLTQLEVLDISGNHHVGAKGSELIFCEEYQRLKYLKSLYFSDTAKTHFIISNKTFKNLHNVHLENLSLPGMHSFSKGALAQFSTLRKILLRSQGNKQTIKDALESISKIPIRSLSLQNVQVGNSILNGTFEQMTDLIELNATTCDVRTVEVQAFSGLFALEVLNLRDNKLQNFSANTFKTNSNLRILDLGKNKLTIVYLEEWGISTNLEELHLDNNYIAELDYLNKKLRRYERLKVLDLNKCLIHQIGISFFGIFTSNLKSMTMRDNKLPKLFGREFSGNNSLIYLDLSTADGKTMRFSKDYPNVNPFEDLTSISVLKLIGCEFDPGYKFLTDMFSNHPHLKELWLQSNLLRTLPKEMFANTTNLEILGLQNNKIDSWNPELFQPFGKSLRFLYLENNNVAFINRTSFVYLKVIFQIDLANNPLICVCELVWFRAWLRETSINLSYIGDKSRYKCYGPVGWKGKQILEYKKTIEDCMDKTFLVISLSASISACVLIVAAIVVFKYRYHIYYAAFYIKTRRQRLLDNMDDTEYTFDAFVAYAGTDRHWVINKLLPEIEVRGGFRLCIHHRDWVPGHEIVANIVESIEESRKVILVLSDEFASSPWCQVEANMAHLQSMDSDRNSLILIMLSEVGPGKMTPVLRHLISSHMYLPWPAGDRDRAAFWRRLRSALKHKNRSRGRQGPETDEEEMVHLADEVTALNQ